MATAYYDKAQQERERQVLKDNGYRWRKDSNDAWVLYDPRGERVEKAKALHDILLGAVPKAEPVFDTTHRLAATTWAKAVALMNAVFLDTETTGVGEGDVVVQLGICDIEGNALVDTLMYNHGVAMNPQAMSTNGIMEMMLVDAPTMKDLWPTLGPILEHRVIVVFNSAFDVRLLEQTALINDLTLPPMHVHCLMKQFSLWYGLTAPGSKDLVYPKLSKACEVVGVEPGTHKALDDAVAACEVFRAMARS